MGAIVIMTPHTMSVSGQPLQTPSDYKSPAPVAEGDANKTLSHQMQMNISSVVPEVTAAFNRYEQALVTNDVLVLDELFFNSPNTIRYGAGEESIGYQAIQKFRQGRVPTNLARDLQNTTITTYGHDFAVVSTEFTRSTSPGKLGRQQQTWVRTEQGWRIVAAHVSTRDLLSHQPNSSLVSGLP